MNKFDLEEMPIDFAVPIIEISEEMPDTEARNHLSGQLIRSGISPVFNYGEAQNGESRKDFIHKVKLVPEELHESYIYLKIIHRSKLYKTEDKVYKALGENNELISFIVRSVETEQKNIKKQKTASIIKNR